MNILIAGGNGGIGLAIVKEVKHRFPDATVHATYHHSRPTLSNIVWHKLDASEERQIARLSKSLDHLDWLVNCVGMLHTQECGPEKSINAIDEAFFAQNIITNTLPSLMLAKYFTPLLKSSANPKFATISAKVGSISDNRLGGWYSYRMSKAALNMMLKTLAIEWRRSVKQGVVLALHPGTTDTRLSKPFQANVPQDKLFEPASVAHDLLTLIDSAKVEDSGSFLAYDGEKLPW